MLPWVVDHVEMDADLVRRWQGGDVDLTRRLPSNLIMEAASQDGRINEAIGGYLGMQELPSALDAVEPLARTVYESGWRPSFAAGPTRDELVSVVQRVI
jgi:hypothetical protein